MHRLPALVGAVALCAAPLLVLSSGPAQAGPALVSPPPPVSSYFPLGEAGGAAEAGGYGLGEAGAIGATAEITVPVLIAATVGYSVYKGWEYFHPKSPGAAAPPSNTTTYGGGSWAGGCSGTYDQVGCGQFSAAYVVTISTALQVGAVAGTGRVTVSAQDNSSQYEVSASAQLRCVDGSTVNDPTSGTWDVPRYGNPGGFAGQQHTFTFDASLCGAAGGTSRFIVAGLNFLYTLGGTLAYPTGGPTTATATPRLSCSDGSTVAGAPVTYDPTLDAPASLTPPGPCPVGTVPTGVSVDDTAAPSGSPAITWTAPQQWTDPQTSPYPTCLPGGTNAPCVMRLQLQTATGWQTCGDQADCTAYQTQPAGSTDTQVTQGANTYQCAWGPYVVPLVDCDGMGPVDEGVATAPATTGVSTPTGSPELGVPPVDTSQGCFPHGWGLINPVSWVQQPVECALRWAFVPDSLAMASTLTQAKTALAATMPWGLIITGPAFFSAFGAGFDNPAACDTVNGGQGTFTITAGDGETRTAPTPSFVGANPWCALASSDGNGSVTVGWMRNLSTGGLWVTFLWACYHRAKRLIGDVGPNDPNAGEIQSGSSVDVSAFETDFSTGFLPEGDYSAERDIDAYNGYGYWTNG